MTRPTISSLLQQSTPERNSLKALSGAPIDQSFGKDGYAYLLEQETKSTGVCTDILKSHVRQDRYYACALQSHKETQVFNSAVWLLDGDGKRDHSFTVDFGSLMGEDKTFTPSSLMEDHEGNLLCLGGVSEAANRLWRFKNTGELDKGFASTGFVDSDQLTAERLTFLFAATLSDGYVIACHTPGFKAVLVALSADGALNPNFGNGGVLDLESHLPGYGAGITSLIATKHAESDRILLLSLRGEGADMFSVLSAINSRGQLDTSFGEGGHFKSENATFYRGLSCSNVSSLVTLCGGHMLADESVQPEIIRLTSNGAPDQVFNKGIPVRFDANAGMWHHMIEHEGRLVGVGSFYNHNRAVRYLADGTLDTTFVSPWGHGSFGATPPNPGFYMDGNSSIAFVPASKRLLVCGDVNVTAQNQVAAVVLALALG
ncbi:delta-60 repeat domain-containing protein [Pseudomonas sp. LLC-1]|uniref:delta-60 repeat domain-containing protein n=1 Tax=Pseudomonas sp. LLC-1 TaxID=1812180 RepID=UPI002115A6EE|nr:delta-60 repeat domain-containing protein [Pseudomonas sp. LLC-1]